MFNNLIDTFLDLKNHHQILFALLITITLIVFWWSVEGICEEFLLHKKYRKISYLIAIIISFCILVMSNYFAKSI